MKTLLVSASASEVRYVVRILQGTLRIGVLEKTLIMGLAQALLITQSLRGEFDPTIPLGPDGGAEEGVERALEQIHVLKKEEGESSKGKEEAKKIAQHGKRKKSEKEEKEEEEEEDEFERKPPPATNREKEEEREEEEEEERGTSEDEEERGTSEDEEEEEEEAEEMEEEEMEEEEEGKTNTRGTGSVGRFPSNDALKEAGEIVNRLFNEMPSYDVIIPILLQDSLQALRNRALLSPGT